VVYFFHFLLICNNMNYLATFLGGVYVPRTSLIA
jgi:hypothetical protein